ncbi:MAG TPA: DNA adenine methylase [Paenalcaligenes sp.]|nr:DNA adenine methylase [Paenalcaligenes sp.]
MLEQDIQAQCAHHSMSLPQPKPFVKWVGGKRQLLAELWARLPDQFGAYYEPFVGGGALFWRLQHQRAQQSQLKACINDFNQELINTYKIVRDYPSELINCLAEFRNDEDFYYQVRAWDRCISFSQRSAVQRAARFIYLNKTGFNGLYRVNKNNQHNVPFGYYKAPNITDTENIFACAKALQNARISWGDFAEISPLLQPGDLVYLDPPYIPLSASSNFTGYTQSGFDLQMQYRLRDFCRKLNARGVYFMQSNSSAELVFQLYKEFNICQVQATRAINANGRGRGPVTELIIRNYT